MNGYFELDHRANKIIIICFESRGPKSIFVKVFFSRFALTHRISVVLKFCGRSSVFVCVCVVIFTFILIQLTAVLMFAHSTFSNARTNIEKINESENHKGAILFTQSLTLSQYFSFVILSSFFSFFSDGRRDIDKSQFVLNAEQHCVAYYINIICCRLAFLPHHSPYSRKRGSHIQKETTWWWMVLKSETHNNIVLY